ncbi:putative secreted protein (Por secretion system target) [Winogradskyella eximia]|uniref:Putative secreted protein (Por secretion system target) n=1 Tax=Winogradskyella eximia TaxID=262006 RepID=A0A3D9HBP6_9FLAO|nr:T9SS type A sorting domain-containing protein [Winogradskyella eximia]RED46902.1 putative secreted protein (Por secretion system target) [Winogradskyella eximia]
MKKQLQFLILLAFLAFSSSQLNAQVDGTFTNNAGAGDGLWSTPTNWTGGIIADATGTATLEANVDIDADTTVGNLLINAAITISSPSNSTLTLTTAVANDLIVNNFAGITTVDCNLTLGINGRFENIAGATTIFANGNTIDSDTFGLTLQNESSNAFEFNGEVIGSGLFNTINSTGNGGATFGATSDFSTFSGDFKNRNHPFIFNSTSKISTGTTIELEGSASITFNVADQFEGDIYKDVQANNTSVVTFNQNQSNLGYLRVNTRPLSLVFADGVNLVQFSSYTTSTTEGVVDLQNYAPGVLRIGTTATTVPQAILDTWLLDGVEPADGTLTQDVDGYIIHNTYTTTPGQDINWEDSSTWIGGKIPSLPTDNVVIHGKVDLNSNLTINNITIEHTTGVQEILDIQPGYSLIVNGDAITKDALRASSSSTSSGSLILKGNITGNIRYNKWVNSRPGNDLIASPVSQTFSTFEASSVNLYENPSTTTQKLFGPFNNVDGVYENWDTVNDATKDIVLGKGYRAATNSGGTVVFQAQPDSPTTDVFIGLTDGGDPTYGKWNLIGNPYPSYLDFDAFWTENSGEINGGSGAYQAVYGYDADDSDGSNFTVWNSFNTSDFVPGQGFFVRTISGGTITFKPAMRTIGTSDDFIAGRTATPNFVLSELFLSNESSTQTTKIYFADNQTRGLDPGYDAAAFTGSTNGIYTNLVEDNEGLEFAIQALPYNDLNDVVVPLGVNGDAGTQLTIGLDAETVSIPSHINVYLEDNVANTWTLLNNSDYIFTPSAELSGTGRFYVHFTPTTLSTKDNLLNGLNIYSEQVSKTVVVKGQLNTDTTAVIYDMQGRLVLQQALDTSNNTNTIDVNALKTGVYIVELKSKTQSKTQKIIVN